MIGYGLTPVVLGHGGKCPGHMTRQLGPAAPRSALIGEPGQIPAVLACSTVEQRPYPTTFMIDSRSEPMSE